MFLCADDQAWFSKHIKFINLHVDLERKAKYIWEEGDAYVLLSFLRNWGFDG